VALKKVGVELTAENAEKYFAILTKGQAAGQEFARGMDTISQRATAADTSILRTTNRIEALSSTLSAQRRQAQLMEQELAGLAAKYGESSVAAQKKQLAIDKLNASIADQRRQAALITNEISELSAKYGEGATQVQKKQLALERLNASMAQNQRAADITQQELSELSTKFSATSAEVQKKQLALDKLTSSIKTNERSLATQVVELDRSSKSSSRWASMMGEVKKGMALAFGMSAVEMISRVATVMLGFFTDSIAAAGDFQAAMNRFTAITGDSLQQAGLDVQQFDDLFMQLGADTQYSAKQAADAAIALAQGGRDANQVYKELDDVLALASAGELELAASAEIAAKQLGVWGTEGVRAADVADLMSQAANASTYKVDELALGLAQAGQVAKDNGLSFKELVTTMASLSSGFASGSDAGTSLKAFLNNLQPTTKDATRAMIDLNLATEDGKSKFYDAEGSFIGMEKATQLLHDSTKDLSTAERALALETIFGADAQRAAGILAEKGAKGYREMTAGMEKAGSATDVAAKKNQGYNFAVEQMRGSLETLQITLGEKLLPFLTDMVNVLTMIVNGTGKVIEFFGDLQIAGVGLGDVFKALIGPGAAAFEMMAEETAKHTKLMDQTRTIYKGVVEALEIAEAQAAEMAASERRAAQATGELGRAGQLTAEELKALNKELEAINKAGAETVGAAMESRMAFLEGYEQRHAEHNETLARLNSEYKAATTDDERQRIADQIQQQMMGHQQTERAEAESYARRQSALNAALGEQLIAYVETQLQLGNMSETEAEKLTNGIIAQYGVAADSMVVLFGEMKQKIGETAQAGEQDTTAIVGGLGAIQDKAIAFEQEFNRRLDAATAGLVEMKESGKITLAEYDELLAGVKTEVRTELLTTFDRDYAIAQIDAAQREASGGGTRVGKAFSDGVAAGINANKQQVAMAARGSVAEAIAQAKAEAIIRSPSRRTADEIGQPLAEGIALGFAEGVPGMVDAVSSGLQTVGSTMAGQMGQIITGLQSQLAAGLAGLSLAQKEAKLQGAFNEGGFQASRPEGQNYKAYAREPIIVGEHGWEVFVPDSAGTIYNQQQLVQPPMTPQQIMQSSYSYSDSRSYTYAPVYHSPPPAPPQDYAAAQASWMGS
jgi:TP901 family phage tail tape measure protein